MYFSVRMRILVGFASVIMTLATANLMSAFGLRGLDGASQQIIAKTDIVRLINDYSADISTQTMALRAFAFSGLDNDKTRVASARSRAQGNRQRVENMLIDIGQKSTATELAEVSVAFDQVLTAMENRLGNENDALQVVVNGVGKLAQSAKNFGDFLETKGGDAAVVSKQLPSIVARFSQSGVAFVASGNKDDFDLAIMAGVELDTLVQQSAVFFSGLPRRDQAVLRYVRRDSDVVRQSLRQKYATGVATHDALNQLEAAAASIANVTDK